MIDDGPSGASSSSASTTRPPGRSDLIYDDSARPFGQHQLVAIGCAERNAEPARSPSTSTFAARSCKSPAGSPLRGFFVEDYSRKLPSASLHLP